MEIIYKTEDGRVVEVATPSLAGSTVTRQVAGDAVSQTDALVDGVAAVSTSFRFDRESGGVLTREVVPWPSAGVADDGTARPTGSTSTVTVIEPGEAARVTEVSVDGARVWPEADDGDTLARINEAMDRLEKLDADLGDGDEGEEGDGWPAPVPAEDADGILDARLRGIIATGRPLADVGDWADPAEDGDPQPY